MSEAKDCPKCGGAMTEGILSVQSSAYAVNWRKGRFSGGEKIVAYRCKQCGYKELYSTEVGQEE
jgi:predicted nucleic-acid-binding Zn-ribbon protein